ncbi:MAG: PASTA domain-containing protein [Desulfobacterales bacterium]|nr:PASTA domain-containing protein [Desulfobacterales bacterium]
MPKKIHSPNELTDALSAPLGDLIAEVGRGVAQAQQSMDLHTVETFKAIHGGDDETSEALRRLGYQPTWYKIPEFTAKISVSLTVSGASVSPENRDATSPGSAPGPARIKLYATPMDANYTNRYNYDLKAASQMAFKIAPVPPSPRAAELKVVPRLEGKAYAEARALLDQLEIPHEPEDKGETDRILKTDPDAGAMLTDGQTVHLFFEMEPPPS